MRIRAILRFKNEDLIKARERIGCFSQKSLAIKMGVNKNIISLSENFKFYPKKEGLIKKFEEALSLPIDFIFPKEYKDAVDRNLGKPIQKSFDILALPEHSYYILPDPAETYEMEERKESILQSLKLLTEKEQEVLKLRFGLDDDKDYTLEEIGQQFNRSRNRILQIENRALRKLKEICGRNNYKINFS